MTVHTVPDCEDIYFLDTPMFGMSEVNSPYLLDTPEPAIVDTGTAEAADDILDGLETLGIAPRDVAYILPTHAHLDHAGSAGHLAERCENATVVCHERGVEYLTDEAKLDELTASVERAIGMEAPYGEPRLIDRERCLAVSGGEEFDLGDRTLEVIDAPGHAPHQYCLFDTTAEVLFSADANGMRFPDVGHRPTTPPPNFDLEDALETVDRLLNIGAETVCYAHYGHGEPGAARTELQDYREMLPAYVERIDALRKREDGDISAIAAEMAEEWRHWSLETDIAGVLRYLD